MKLEAFRRLDKKHQDVAIAIGQHDTFDGNEATPALRWIVAVTHLSLATVQRAVKQMASLGELTITRRGRDSFRYRLSPALARDVLEIVQSPNRETHRFTAETQSPKNGTGEEGRIESLSERGESGRAPVLHKNIHTDPSRAARALPSQRNLLLPISAPPAPPEDPAVAKQRKRERWLSTLGEYVRDVEPNELARFWQEALKPADEVRRYLNQVDARMRLSHWHRERERRRRA